MGCRFLGLIRGGGTGGAVLSSGIWLKICNHIEKEKEKSHSNTLVHWLLFQLHRVLAERSKKSLHDKEKKKLEKYFFFLKNDINIEQREKKKTQIPK